MDNAKQPHHVVMKPYIKRGTYKCSQLYIYFLNMLHNGGKVIKSSTAWFRVFPVSSSDMSLVVLIGTIET